jgi:hypothetical protein
MGKYIFLCHDDTCDLSLQMLFAPCNKRIFPIYKALGCCFYMEMESQYFGYTDIMSTMSCFYGEKHFADVKAQ